MTNSGSNGAANASARTLRPTDPKHDYQHPDFGKRVNCLYFYYVKPDRSVLAYYHDNGNDNIGSGEMKTIVERLAKSAFDNDGVPPPNALKFNGFKWRRRSHIVVAISLSGWETEEVEVYNNVSLYSMKHNESIRFRDKHGSTVTLPIVRCINHMKKKANSEEDLKEIDGDKYVRFTIYPKVRQITPVEADGTNLGPPVPPPYSHGFLALLHNLLEWLAFWRLFR